MAQLTELTKNMKAVLDEQWGDTTKAATAEKMAQAGLITIDSRWVLTRGSPGMSAQGDKPGRWVVGFTVNEAHPLVVAYRAEKRKGV